MADRRSRYPKPGSTVACYTDYPAKWGTAVVLETSRHKSSYPEAEAARDLTEMYAADGATVELERCTWQSVTQADVDSIEADPGDWHSEGSGAAWVKVLTGMPTYPEPSPDSATTKERA